MAGDSDLSGDTVVPDTVCRDYDDPATPEDEQGAFIVNIGFSTLSPALLFYEEVIGFVPDDDLTLENATAELIARPYDVSLGYRVRITPTNWGEPVAVSVPAGGGDPRRVIGVEPGVERVPPGHVRLDRMRRGQHLDRVPGAGPARRDPRGRGPERRVVEGRARPRNIDLRREGNGDDGRRRPERFPGLRRRDGAGVVRPGDRHQEDRVRACGYASAGPGARGGALRGQPCAQRRRDREPQRTGGGAFAFGGNGRGTEVPDQIGGRCDPSRSRTPRSRRVPAPSSRSP